MSPVFVPLTEAVADAVKVAPSAIVSVAPVAGAVTVILLRLVAVAAPISGVTSVGEVSTTNLEPVPVWLAITVALPVLVITPVRFALVVTVAAEPVVFWLSVGKVQFVKVPDVGVPRTGVISVGLVSITNLVPVPVWLAIEVALPIEVITPVRLAFVVAVTEMPLPSAVALNTAVPLM